MQEALSTVNDIQSDAARLAERRSQDAKIDDEEQVVVFRLGKEEFGVPIESVQEIVRLPDEMTHVPKAPPSVEGVINLRGAVLPVIDLRRRLGLAAVERSDRQRIIVLLIESVRTGFIVDSVAEVLKVPKSTIEPAPRLSGEQSQLLARMANLEKLKRMVQLIEPLHLIEKQQLAGIAELAAA
jgi:purine-binding chemotaxis protein CheW